MRLVLHLLALVPFAALFVRDLGVNPAEFIIRDTGTWAITFLAITLLITPVREIIKRPKLAQYRRMFGLYAFFYTLVHLSAYVVFDKGMVLGEVVADVIDRPFITLGMVAFVGLLALAITSIPSLIRKMGAKAWKRLHKAVYFIAIVALAHFVLMRAGKNNFGDIIPYALVIGAALFYRWRKAK